jgi:type I restriction enzyme S subunit
MTELISTIKNKSIPYHLNDNWKWYKWGDLIESYQQGLIRSNSQLNPDFGIDYFKMSFINEDGSYSFENLPKTMASEEEVFKFGINSGDFFINVRNSKELVGKACVVYSVDKDILFNHMLVRIKHKKHISGSFINAYLNSDFGKKLLDTCKKGTTTVVALYQKDLYELPIPLPNNQLLTVIDNIYNSINIKIELNNRINLELEAMAKLLYEYWFVQFDFPYDLRQSKPADETSKPQDIKPYKSSGGKMVWNKDLNREIPEGWDIHTLDYWIEKDKNGDWGKEEIQGNYDLRVSCIRGADINSLNGNGELKSPVRFILEKNSHKLLDPGDLVIEISGGSPTQSTGRLGYIINETLERFNEPIICSNFCKAITLKNESTQFNFIYEWRRLYDAGVFFGYEGKTSGIKNFLFESFVSKHKISIPPVALLERFYEKAITINTKIQRNLIQNQELSSLRDWLLPMLMNGQISVADAEERVSEELGMVAEEKERYEKK